MIAIMVSTAALIIVLSVFNGFEGLVQSLYGDFYADLKIVPATGKYITVNDSLVHKIRLTAGVKQISFVAEEKAVLVNGDYQTIVYLKGVDKNYNNVNKLNQYITNGKYDIGTIDAPSIVAGSGIADAVGADPQSPLSDLLLYLPNRKAKNFSSIDAMHSFQVKPAGIFSVQQEFDDKYAFTNLAFMQYMLDLNADELTAVEVASVKNKDVKDVQKALQSSIGKSFTVQTRYQQNQSLFSVMEIEKWVIYGILSLILLIAAFNMIGALTMLVLEKEKDIAVLKAMGASENRIKNIFLGEGFLLAGFGGIFGMVIAYAICFAQIKFKLIKLEGGTFIIDYYPVKMITTDFLLVTFTVLIVATIASIIPAKKAAAQFFSLKS